MKKDKKKHYATNSHKEAVARAEGARKEVENLSLPSTSKLELRRIKNKLEMMRFNDLKPLITTKLMLVSPHRKFT